MNFFDYRDGQLFCEGVSVDAIADEAGTPLYIYSKAHLLERYNAIADAFKDVDTTICFSVKSCSSLGILKVLKDAGSSFDVVSGGELFRVIKAGGDASKVVYAGVGKTDKEIRYALEQGILMFNVESHAELETIDRIAGEMGKVAPVALRLNPDVDPKTHMHTTTGKLENKFGLDFQHAGEIVDNLGKTPNILLRGIHLHIGSPVNSVEPYGEAIDKALGFIEEHKDGCASVEYLNTGGGFGLFYSKENVPAFAEYAKVITERAKKAGKKLIIEPGRSIVGNAGIMLATVQYVKFNGLKNFVITDSGMNDLIRPALYDSYHHIWPTRTSTPALPGASVEGVSTVKSDVVGPICESGDFFAKDRLLPDVSKGERLAIFSAGAYGFTMSSTYNTRPRAAEVLVDGEEWKIIRKREQWEDLVALESAE
ncbi:MAG: diaminopimelate decarboxylase [Planctomycetes bacterium]|nr:diaminopimelate decarboxylase [Planctomycetota bacterium]